MSPETDLPAGRSATILQNLTADNEPKIRSKPSCTPTAKHIYPLPVFSIIGFFHARQLQTNGRFANRKRHNKCDNISVSVQAKERRAKPKPSQNHQCRNSNDPALTSIPPLY